MQYPDSLYYQGKSYKLDEIRPLPELVEKAVRGIGSWQVVRYSQNPTADRARFVESYKTLVRRRRERRELPQVREMRRKLEQRKVADLEIGA